MEVPTVDKSLSNWLASYYEAPMLSKYHIIYNIIMKPYMIFYERHFVILCPIPLNMKASIFIIQGNDAPNMSLAVLFTVTTRHHWTKKNYCATSYIRDSIDKQQRQNFNRRQRFFLNDTLYQSFKGNKIEVNQHCKKDGWMAVHILHPVPNAWRIVLKQ